MLGPYNGFTGEQRLYGEQIIKKAIKEGRLLPKNRTKCIICGQDKGIRDYHTEDYSPENIVEESMPMCRFCHNKLHKFKNKHPEKWQRYLDRVEKGYRPPPMYNQWWGPEDDYHGDDETYEKQTTLNQFEEKDE